MDISFKNLYPAVSVKSTILFLLMGAASIALIWCISSTFLLISSSACDISCKDMFYDRSLACWTQIVNEVLRVQYFDGRIDLRYISSDFFLELKNNRKMFEIGKI